LASMLTITFLMRDSCISTDCRHLPIATRCATCMYLLPTFRVNVLCGDEKLSKLCSSSFLCLFVLLFILHCVCYIEHFYFEYFVFFFAISTLNIHVQLCHDEYICLCSLSRISPSVVNYLKYKTCTYNGV
jgi:hypothetical protein